MIEMTIAMAQELHDIGFEVVRDGDKKMAFAKSEKKLDWSKAEHSQGGNK